MGKFRDFVPGSCRSRGSAEGRDLPDADGPEFVSPNGGFKDANRSVIGHFSTLDSNNRAPVSCHTGRQCKSR